MRVAALADVLKVILFVIASFLLAALITPTLYEIGKGFANVAISKDTVDRVTWLATKADRAGFNSYFRRALLLSALICLIPLFYSLDLRRHARHRRGNPWTVGLPPSSTPPRMGQVLQKKTWGIFQSLTAFFLTTGLCLAFTWTLFALGWLEWEDRAHQINLWVLLWKSFKYALILGIIEETIFRGAFLGIFLRAFRPSIAIITLSLIFASVHFLAPPNDSTISDPRDSAAGFEMLSLIWQHSLLPRSLILDFIPLFTAGLILGLARYLTSSLWLPIGLHSAWIFSHHFFSPLTQKNPDLAEKYQLYLGESIREGIAPTLLLMISSLLIILYLRFTREKTPKQVDG